MYMLLDPPPLHRLVTSSSKVQLIVNSQSAFFSTNYGVATFNLGELVARHGPSCKYTVVVDNTVMSHQLTLACILPIRFIVVMCYKVAVYLGSCTMQCTSCTYLLYMYTILWGAVCVKT